MGCAVVGFGVILLIFDTLLRCTDRSYLMPDLRVADHPVNIEAALDDAHFDAPPPFSTEDWNLTGVLKRDSSPDEPSNADTSPLLFTTDQQRIE